MHRIFLAATVLVAIFACNVLSQPLPSPQPPKTPGQYRLGTAGQHLQNAGWAGKEAVKAAGCLAASGVIGACGASTVGQAIARPIMGVAGGVTVGAVHAVSAGASAVCAAGQACGYLSDKAKQIGKNRYERAAQDRDRGVKLATFKKESRKVQENLVQSRQRASRAVAGVLTREDVEHHLCGKRY